MTAAGSSPSRIEEILRRLDQIYADMTTGLNFSNPFELLVATILSAQCTDERVNTVTPSLFNRFPSVDLVAAADTTELETIIYSCGFFRAKARNIQAAARALLDRFDGKVPQTMAELVSLPGVARKTANVVLAHAYGKHEGVAVDTHVLRLSRRLGLTSYADPVRVEAQLMDLLPPGQWGRLSDVLIWHGRRVCVARNPRCGSCPVVDLCPSAGTGALPSSTKTAQR